MLRTAQTEGASTQKAVLKYIGKREHRHDKLQLEFLYFPSSIPLSLDRILLTSTSCLAPTNLSTYHPISPPTVHVQILHPEIGSTYQSPTCLPTFLVTYLPLANFSTHFPIYVPTYLYYSPRCSPLANLSTHFPIYFLSYLYYSPRYSPTYLSPACRSTYMYLYYSPI